MRRAVVLLVIVGAFLASAAPASARPYWKRQLDRIVAGHNVGVALHDNRQVLYRHDDKVLRPPASNQKLLMSMALYDAFDPQEVLDTQVFSTATPTFGIISGDLWLASEGDPSLGAGEARSRSLPFRATNLRDVADLVRAAGITQINGRVFADMSYFEHDWMAPGWKSTFPHRYIPLPSAVTYEGNFVNDYHFENPEWRAARALTRALEAVGVTVAKRPRAGTLPAGLNLVGGVTSEELEVLVRYMNRKSSNFFAEVLGKRLGVEVLGVPGTIAKGATAIEMFAATVGVDLVAHDSSGLSYANEVSPRGIVRLLTHVETSEDYYEVLQRSLARGGQGTLEDRLRGVPVRAKTGSLHEVSALSGWVRLAKTDSWAEFSILSSGLSYTSAKNLEDRIVKLIHRLAR